MAKRKPAVAKPAPDPVQEEPDRLIRGQKAFAKLNEVSTKTVQNWQDGGMPFRDLGSNKYEYDLDETEPWLEAFRAASAKDPEAIKTRSAREDAKLRIELVEAEEAELELARKKGNILPRDEYELFLTEQNILVRDLFLEIPKQMRRHLPPNSGKALSELEKLIKKALEHLADKSKGPQ